jgi:glycosyltransferase involved in cell wall biosynthesis
LAEASVSLSVIVPVYSGEAYLRPLLLRLEAVRTGWREQGAPFQLNEVILVDDSAVDGSPALVDALAREYSWVVPLHLMRNFGQHPATIAGILYSSGDWVVTMDEDLQHPPEDIEAMLRQAVTTGSDIVYANPAQAVHEAALRDWASRGSKTIMAALTGNQNIRLFSSFRLIRGPLARAASSVCGYETYFDVALSWYTLRVGSVKLNLKDKRFITSGKSGYNLRRLLTHARRLLISSQVKTVRMFGALGIAVVGMSLLFFLWVVFAKTLGVSDRVPAGWASIMGVNLFFGGFVTLLLAIVLEYLSTLVLAANGKPIFFVVDRSADQRLVQHFLDAPT